MEAAEKMKKAIDEATDGQAETQVLGNQENTFIKIREMDALTDEDELISALASETLDGTALAETATVVRTFLYPWQERAAVVRMPIQMAAPLVEKGRIRMAKGSEGGGGGARRGGLGKRWGGREGGKQRLGEGKGKEEGKGEEKKKKKPRTEQ